MVNVAYQSKDDRQAERLIADAPATLRSSDEAFDAVVIDLSTVGFQAETDRKLRMGQRVWIGVGGERLGSASVTRVAGERYGFAFDRSISQESLNNALTGSEVLHGEFRLGSPFTAQDGNSQARPAPGVGTAVGLIAISVVAVAAGICVAAIAAPVAIVRHGLRLFRRQSA